MPSLIILAKAKRRKDKQKIFVKKEQAHVLTKKIQVKGSKEHVTQ